MAASMSHYGLGWMSGEYRGLREISHTGGTTGFTAQVAFLPAADLGIAVLSNASASPGALAFALYSEAYGATVSFTGGIQQPRVTLTIPGNPTGPEQAYVFEPSRA
jgi:CubicO group peptidase (beta-lactamase class C family)